MADTVSMSIDESTVRSLAALLKSYHAREAPSGQNDGSNMTDDARAGLEMRKGTSGMADLQGFYAQLDSDERYDLAALALLGMDEAESFDDARNMAAEAGQPGMSEFLEMPLSPQFLTEGLQKAGYPSGGHDPARRPSDDEHAG